MKIAIGNDHTGVEYKFILKKFLEDTGHEVINFGTDETSSCDYPDYADKVAKAIQRGEADRGVLICGTGVGMSIAANKHKGIRASLCGDTYSAEFTRRHNDSNILVMGARVIGVEIMLSVAKVYFSTGFEGGRHQRRIDKIDELSDF